MSNTEDNRLLLLYQKFQSKTASVEELTELNNFLASEGAEQHLFELIEKEYQLSEIKQPELSEFRAAQIFQQITSQPQTHRKIRSLWPRIAGVAAIAGMLVISILFKDQFLSIGNQSQVVSSNQDIAPGKSAATLTLANGRKILLTSVPSGELANESGVTISKTSNGEILYEIKENSETKPGQHNLLSTAMGETYQVKLPDGSRVWLNAASSLKYPVSFSSLKDRRVELHGEAYFEVAKDKLHPFLVETDGQEVTVLGTHFNIKAYKQDKNIVTTLAEGSVRVGYQASAWSDHGKIVYKDEVILSPGQQSLLKGETISVSKAALEESLAWKDGNFVFNDANIEKIMQDIARWYNIEVLYEGPFPTGAFSGNISRSKNISQILRALESTKLVHFKIEGRKVYVSK
ncbi:FecR family protein [Mucilaginibacter aquariorum]|uniref:FecR domain-containing protein n=1 Tax=Mucilaginibacter aquariorum TaxID=2967225 RepID=A0ABT1SXZ2_9SPHI|nr:FecR family protein [Mucilaginibacter aquariorum]MCQ6957219.1 FecR domain-containing protein [Mucilaginibacter aquariorum]